MTDVVKRKGHLEKFDERKVYGSVYAACAIEEMEKRQCESIANFVSEKVKNAVKNKKEITSKQIRELVIKYLKNKNKNATFIYETHKDLS